MTRTHCGLLGLVAALVVAPFAGDAAGVDQVKTANGVVEGIGPQSSGIRMFKGIPFAEPPVGALRWKAPQPPKNWAGVRQATQFGPRCMQQPLFGDMNFRSNGMSEDCLYLNVWTPAKSAGERLPVLVYFFGGGFRAGDGSEPRYDGESMARKGIVALSVNYRLGEFGFFAHPELTRESPQHASGNQGFLDQTAALQWVKQNIAAFGGDPAKVTIAGESAGSIAVSAQMASPIAKSLFARAIGESGALIAPTTPPVPLAEAEQIGAKFAAFAGAESLEALRAMTTQQIFDAAAKPGAGRFPPAIDGYFLPKAPVEIFAAGQQAHVPLLVGSNSEEQGARSVLGSEPPTVEAFASAVRRLFPDRGGRGAEGLRPRDRGRRDAGGNRPGERSIHCLQHLEMDGVARPHRRQPGVLLLLRAAAPGDGGRHGQCCSRPRGRRHAGDRHQRRSPGGARAAPRTRPRSSTRWATSRRTRCSRGRRTTTRSRGRCRTTSPTSSRPALRTAPACRSGRRRTAAPRCSACASTSSRGWSPRRAPRGTSALEKVYGK